MPEASFQLEHVNLPARDPLALARWYADTLGLRADEHRVRGPGVLLVFAEGEPVNRAPEFHLGMRVPSMRLLNEWADKLKGTIKAGPEVKNFDQIHVGDVLTARYLESVALVVRKADAGPSANESRTVEVAPKGHKPAARIAETKEVTATVEAIDYATRTVTLRGPEGNARTIKVDPSVKRLNDVKKGDQVVARYTEGLAISVKTPPPPKTAAPPAAPAPATK